MYNFLGVNSQAI